MSNPEIRTPLLMGIWGSAFCATLAHYYKEIRPLVKGLTGFGGLDQMMQENQDDLGKVHPITPAQIPNYVKGMSERLPQTCPKSVHTAQAIQLMDAGMSNNLPIYPLLRPGRNVDMIICFDSSADIKQENWLRVADGYARQRNIRGWPIGTGWPDSGDDDTRKTMKALDEASSATAKKAQGKAAQSDKYHQRKKTAEDSTAAEGESRAIPSTKDLSYCNIWVGSTQERLAKDKPPKSKLVEDDFTLMSSEGAGIAVIYFPFLANPAVEGVDPEKSDYMSTWNFVYTPDQVEKVVDLARANFDAGERQVKRAIRAVYERKKRLREDRERRESQHEAWWQF